MKQDIKAQQKVDEAKQAENENQDKAPANEDWANYRWRIKQYWAMRYELAQQDGNHAWAPWNPARK